MPWSAVAWADQDELTSAKLAQMVENLRVHDHRFDGSRGAPVPRILTGSVAITPTANTTTWVPVTFPAGFFDPAGPVPVGVANPESSVTGSTCKSWGVSSETHTGADVWIHRTNGTTTTIRYVIVQAPA